MPDPSTKTSQHSRTPLIILLVVLGIIAAWGIVSRVKAEHDLRRQTEEDAIPTVAVIQVPQGPASEELVLPGSVQAWHEAPIYARTNGYIKEWKTDIGARVKAGDLLAEIETPEVDAQLHQAEADLASAEANNKLAQVTAKRWTDLLKAHAVSQQDADDKIAAATANAAAVASSKANVDHLQQLEEFKHVVAPFDGIITARNTDNGALINAGSSGTGPELFHIAETDKLRIYAQVPEYDATFIKPDLTAELHLAEYPQRNFTAKLIHTADAIDPASRTLLVQFEADNAEDALLPGSYAEVHIKLPSSGAGIRLPVNTFLFRSEGMQVATIDGDGKAVLKPVQIGRDYGKEIEVTSGITEGETIIINPPDSLMTGQKVKIAEPKPGDVKKAPEEKKADDGKNPLADKKSDMSEDTKKNEAKNAAEAQDDDKNAGDDKKQ